jgi:hypothetical protein
MTRYDPELIAALAEGRLDPQEAEALERAIAADPVASADLAAQRTALEAMRQEPAPMLSSSERSDLRNRIAAELGLTPVDAPAPAPRRIAWGSIAVAAAALVGVIAIVPVVGLLTTSGDGDSAAVSLADETDFSSNRSTTAEAEVAAPGAMTEDTLQTLDDTPATTAAPTTSGGDGGSLTTVVEESTTTSGAVTTDAPPTTTDAQERERSAWLTEWRDTSADPGTAAEADPTVPCFDQADAHIHEEGDAEDLLVEPVEYSEDEAVAFYVVDETGEVGAIAAFLTETCELIAALE